MSEQGNKINRLKVADLVRSGDLQNEAVERAPGIWESRGVGNSYLVTTHDGSILVNAGTLADAKRGLERFSRVSSEPIRHIILTQSHANQYGGVEIYKTEDTQVIAHRIYAQDRVYAEALSAHYRRGSRRIFGGITGRTEDLIPTREVAPDLLIGDDGHAFECGGRRFEIIWTPGGETRSAVIVWLPRERIAIVGNLFGPLFGNQPNLNTLRGDKPRSAAEFISSVEALRALEPVLVLTGHEAIEGAEYISTAVTRIADSVRWIHGATITGMNEGKSLRTLMHEVVPPDNLRLSEDYGKVAWNVRAIWHEYTGWFDPTNGTTDLYASTPASIAPALAELVGDVAPMIEKARSFIASGQPLQALHMLDIVFASEVALPEDARAAKREALTLLDRQSSGTNLWEKRWIASEIRLLDEEPGGGA